MQIRIIVDPKNLRRWQAEAIRAVAAKGGRRVRFDAAPQPRLSPTLAAVLAAEGVLYRRPADHPLAPASLDDVAGLSAAADGPDDLVVDLVGAAPPPGALALAVAGRDVEAGAFATLLAGGNPTLTLLAGATDGPRALARWTVGVEQADVLFRGVEPTLGRAVEMLALAADAVASGRALAAIRLPDAPDVARGRPTAPLAFFLRAFARRLRRRLPGAPEMPRWHVAWRTDAGGEDALPALGGRPFIRLADDGARFYADPFLVRRDGQTVLFVEEFPFARGRGMISAVEMTGVGPVGRPVPVLVEDCHLSYPFPVEHGGELFMVPESSERRTVELWRCRRFPDQWEREAVLLADVDVGDATLFEADGGWFMLGARRPRWGSSWDGLDLFAAPALVGPWRPVGRGPVKVDVASARPAGRPFRCGGRLIRPFQDSAGGYGAGLGFAEVDACGEAGYAERTVLACRARPPLLGIHSYARGHGLEVIDLFAARPPAEVSPC